MLFCHLNTLNLDRIEMGICVSLCGRVVLLCHRYSVAMTTFSTPQSHYPVRAELVLMRDLCLAISAPSLYCFFFFQGFVLYIRIMIHLLYSPKINVKKLRFP